MEIWHPAYHAPGCLWSVGALGTSVEYQWYVVKLLSISPPPPSSLPLSSLVSNLQGTHLVYPLLHDAFAPPLFPPSSSFLLLPQVLVGIET